MMILTMEADTPPLLKGVWSGYAGFAEVGPRTDLAASCRLEAVAAILADGPHAGPVELVVVVAAAAVVAPAVAALVAPVPDVPGTAPAVVTPHMTWPASGRGDLEMTGGSLDTQSWGL